MKITYDKTLKQWNTAQGLIEVRVTNTGIFYGIFRDGKKVTENIHSAQFDGIKATKETVKRLYNIEY